MERMANMIGILLLALAVVYADDMTLEVSPSGIIKQGDNVILTCSVTRTLVSRFIDGLKYMKKNGEKTSDVSYNAVVEEPFKGTGRYDANYRDDLGRGLIIVTLNITGIQAADSGDFLCVLENQYDLKMFTVVTVAVPVESVALSTTETPTIEEGKEAMVKEGEVITCMVNVKGNYIPPTIKTTLGGADVTTTQSDQVTNENNKGLLKLAYKGSVEYKVTKEDSDKTFVCQAEYADHPPAKTASAILNVLFKPVFECEKSVTTNVGKKNIQLTCKATGNPLPAGSQWSFGAETVVKQGEANPDGYVASNKVINDDVVEFTLTIPEVKESDLQKYTLTASNEAGESMTEINLQAKDDGQAPTTPSKPIYTVVIDKSTKSTKKPKTGQSTGSASGLVSMVLTSIICLLTIKTIHM